MPSRRTLLAAAAVLVESAATAAQGGCESRKASPTVAKREPDKTGRPWILVAPHPDDETLGAGVMIAEHVAAGRDVHILLLTRGTGSTARQQINGAQHSRWWGVAHNPAAEGYAPLTSEAFGKARYDELTAALGCLGGGRVHEAGLIDGQVTVAAVKSAISALVDEIGHGAGVYAPSWLVDDNPDHRAAGQALRELAAEQPAVYGDVSWYVLPVYWSDSRLGQVAWSWDKPTDTEISNRARNACRAYAAWHPPHSYAIGYHSVDFMFALIDSDPRSMLHK
ncbi:PIG-L family deacetylase [Dactylosporangium fulvum]|uniref:PIG-L family deacetylase n=1 Tax=Dactylosporangium fulvum TaxID=53359 RepID=A0ABY5VZE0_9ACTN|nr:PIG-L family deacetylase [Dactylosporangium fulvum]UWP83035.1 PIG-L family deacetylase [Dactylosporangium fulvum]